MERGNLGISQLDIQYSDIPLTKPKYIHTGNTQIENNGRKVGTNFRHTYSYSIDIAVPAITTLNLLFFSFLTP